MNKVFGVGLGKTGTKTLKYALLELGFKKYVKCKQKFTTAYKTKKTNRLKAMVLGERTQFSDYPWAVMYKEISEWYPDGYFILTRRLNEDKWFESNIKHIATRGMSSLNFRNIFDMDIKHIDEAKLKNFYINHNKNVREHFKDHPRFIELCWEEGDGWNELCTFLNKPVLKKDFPWKNRISKK